MIGILAEDDSDAEALKRIVRRYLCSPGLSVRGKGYGGGGDLLNKGRRDIAQWLRDGVTRFVVCHDSDTEPPGAIEAKVRARVVDPAGVAQRSCVAVPVQELEAWLIADEEAIRQVIPSFRFGGHENPERINSPKEWLEGQSERAGGKPRYVPALHNARVAEHVRLEVVGKKCPSFVRFANCLERWRSLAQG